MIPYYHSVSDRQMIESHIYHVNGDTLKRPQTVRECKKISNNKERVTPLKSHDGSYFSRPLSASTSNLEEYLQSNRFSHPPQKNSETGVLNHNNKTSSSLFHPTAFKSFQDNRNSKSLEALSIFKKSVNLTGFVPDKPFYPPSKYPSIHDKGDKRIQRLIETRERYKTPQSRKNTLKNSKHQSILNFEEFQTKRSTSRDYNFRYGSLPNVNKKNSQGSNDSSKGSQMAESLISEPLYPLKNYKRNIYPRMKCNPYEYRGNNVDHIESPSICPSDNKQLSSFSNDSLDGTKIKNKLRDDASNNGVLESNEDDRSSGINSEDTSLDSKYYKALHKERPGISRSNPYVCCEYEQYNLDEIINIKVGMKDASSFINSDIPITIQNEFLDCSHLLVTDKYNRKWPKKLSDQPHDRGYMATNRSLSSGKHQLESRSNEYRINQPSPRFFRLSNPAKNIETDHFCDQNVVLKRHRQVYPLIKKNRYNCHSFINKALSKGINSTDQFYDIKSLSPIERHFQKRHYTNTSNNEINELTNDNPFNTKHSGGIVESMESTSTNELSWSGYDSCKDYVDLNLGNQRNGIAWMSNPELNSLQFTRIKRPLTQMSSPLQPLCNFCHKPAYFMERISISNIIFHKSCFRCRKCDTHLNFYNCILHRKRPYCIVHVRPKMWKGIKSASTNKLHHIKERLDNKNNLQKQSSTEAKQQKRIFYEGIKSAKNKLIDEATKKKEPQLRDPKRITPPRQGVNSGVVESEPKPRDPNIVACRDNQSSYFDEMEMLAQSTSAKENRGFFKELHDRSSGSKDAVNGNSEEYLNRKPVVPSVDTKFLRNRFLEGGNDSENKLKKINPLDEIQRFAQQEVNSIYENEPETRADVLKSDTQKQDLSSSQITRIRAKEMKEKFLNIGQEDKPRKSEFKLEYGEGGVYESNPQEHNEDVVKYNYDTGVYLPENTVKSGLQRIKELQNIKSQGFQKSNTEQIKIEVDPSMSGIFENTPEQSRADSISYQNNVGLTEFREKNYTNEGKKMFLDKQKEEETVLKKSTPRMIDIWNDLCPDSGIFENEPKEQRKDVVKYGESSDELMTESRNHDTNGNDVSDRDIVTTNNHHETD